MTQQPESKATGRKSDLEGEIAAAPERDLIAPEDLDRSFQIDPWSLSAKELEALLGQYLTLLNETTNVAPKIELISSHRGLIGAPIVAIKRLLFKLIRPFTDTLLANQKIFNGRLVETQLAQFALQTRLRGEINAAIERLRSLEEDSVILREQMARLQQSK
jgi:hypothetical protein